MQGLAPGAQRSEVDAFAAATRDLVGVALRSIAPEGVTVPQFRLLLVLHEQGRTSSSAVARTLGLAPSSVTRLADRLVVAGLAERGGVPEHRGVVTLSLRPAGTLLVLRVLQRRVDELAAVLDCLEPGLRTAAAEALRTVHDLLGANQAIGPVVL
jgi:DNA-binding MarR family transcriptional regulator